MAERWLRLVLNQRRSDLSPLISCLQVVEGWLHLVLDQRCSNLPPPISSLWVVEGWLRLVLDQRCSDLSLPIRLAFGWSRNDYTWFSCGFPLKKTFLTVLMAPKEFIHRVALPCLIKYASRLYAVWAAATSTHSLLEHMLLPIERVGSFTWLLALCNCMPPNRERGMKTFSLQFHRKAKKEHPN